MAEYLASSCFSFPCSIISSFVLVTIMSIIAKFIIFSSRNRPTYSGSPFPSKPSSGCLLKPVKHFKRWFSFWPKPYKYIITIRQQIYHLYHRDHELVLAKEWRPLRLPRSILGWMPWRPCWLPKEEQIQIHSFLTNSTKIDFNMQFRIVLNNSFLGGQLKIGGKILSEALKF